MDITYKVEKLFRPAIDAYMVSQPGYWGKDTIWSDPDSSTPLSPNHDWVPLENAVEAKSAYGYIMQIPEYVGKLYVISPPDANGSDGGRVLMCLDADSKHELGYKKNSNPYINQFEEIRRSLTTKFLYFHDLPVPSSFDPQIELTKAAIREVAFDFYDTNWGFSEDLSNAVVNTPSELSGFVKAIAKKIEDPSLFAGNAVTPLQLRYGAGLANTIQAIWGLLYIYGGHIAAERELWRAGNEWIDSVLVQSYKSFSRAATRSTAPVDWDLLLDLVGTASKGITLLGVPAGAVISAVADIAGVVVSASDPSTPPEQEETSSFYDVMGFIETALSRFRSTVREEEHLIKENIRENLANINRHAGFYDRSGGLFVDKNRGPENGAEGLITWTLDAAAQVSSLMRNASPLCASAATKLSDTSIWDAATRPILLGDSTTGPALELDDFGATLRTLLIAISEELALGATNVDAATDLMMATEAGIRRTVSTLESQIDLTPISHLESPTITLDPLAVNAPDIAPLDIRSLMETQKKKDHILGFGRV